MKGRRARAREKDTGREPGPGPAPALRLARRRLGPVWLVIGFLAGAGATAALLMTREAPASDPGDERHEGQQGLINPLLECGAGRNLGPTHKAEAQVRALVERRITEGLGHVSVYFRDLNNGPWFGIREKELFQPSSLNKVQIMLEFLKAAEADPTLLRRTVRFDARTYDATSVVPNFRPSRQLQDGETYTVDDLIRYMIVYSDNAAAQTLVESRATGRQFKFCPDDTPYPCEGGLARLVSVKNYAGVFRILFNASFVNRALSQHGLELLAEAEYRDGIVAGVPAGVTVAHKFGEGEIDGVKQLHDCGVVYFPRHPYLLCIMTRGRDFQRLGSLVREISQLIYSHVQRAAARR